MSNQKDYKIGDNKTHTSNGPKMGPGGMGRMGKGEKPKDFKKSWSKLIGYSKSYLPVIILAVILAIT
ncbi:MAG: ABC transporter ATP-binding protein, partial [Clostridia bacterium]